MSTEPLTSTVARPETAAASERGLLIALFVLVVLGAGGMLLIG